MGPGGHRLEMTAADERPAVSVVVPFAGEEAEGRRALEALGKLRLRTGDEVIVVDNNRRPRVPSAEASAIRVVAASDRASSYYARNVGAAAAANPWLLFLDADCVPSPHVLDRYFEPPPAERCGIVVGEIVGDPSQATLAARWARARGHLQVSRQLDVGPHPAGATANLLVRRATWEELGGFCEVRSGADLEFCWRAGERGWALEHRPDARVVHHHAESVRAMLQKARRYGSGQVWAHRRFPSYRRPPDVLHHLWRALVGVPAWLVTLRVERAAFKALDLAWHVAYAWGYRFDDNGATERSPR